MNTEALRRSGLPMVGRDDQGTTWIARGDVDEAGRDVIWAVGDDIECTLDWAIENFAITWYRLHPEPVDEVWE